MPCYDSRSGSDYNSGLLTEAEARIDKLASLLCYLCGKVEKENPGLLTDTANLWGWWTDHKAHDAKRNSAPVTENKKEIVPMVIGDQWMFTDWKTYAPLPICAVITSIGNGQVGFEFIHPIFKCRVPGSDTAIESVFRQAWERVGA